MFLNFSVSTSVSVISSPVGPTPYIGLYAGDPRNVILCQAEDIENDRAQFYGLKGRNV